MNRKRTLRCRLIAGVAAVALGGAALPAAGQLSYEWTRLGDGTTYSDPLNWLPNGVPGSLDEAKFDSGGVQTVRFVTNALNALGSIENETVLFDLAGRVYTASELIVGERLTDVGVLTIDGGSLVTTTGLLQIGRRSPSHGSLFISNGATMTNQRDLIVGDEGNGYFQLDAGCSVDSFITFLADAAGSTGEAIIRGTWNIQTSALIGNGGAGVFAVESGADVTVGSETKLGDEPGSSGSLTIDGTGSTWSSTFATTVGNFGLGTLTVSNGGLLTTAGLKIADDFLGAVVIDNASVIDMLGTGVGNRAAGTLTLANGGSIESPLVSVVTLGTFGGSGTVVGSVLNDGATNPGNGAGVLDLTGDFTQLLGTLNIELGGAAIGSGYDQLAAGGIVTLGGTLNVSLINGYNPSDGEFVIVQGGMIMGAFVVENLPPNFTVTYEATRVVVSIGDACQADVNGDGIVNTLDFIAYLNLWVAGNAEADVNGDGTVNTLDFIAYLNLWVAGC